ncbi:MAG: hypothetical protein R2828_24960 [Saprospiraceae bacterium]
MQKKFRIGEILLIQILLYLFCWLMNDYLASMISIILGSIFLAILVVSLVVELVERSKVPRWYFYLMLASVFAPIIAAVIYLGINKGVDWMN